MFFLDFSTQARANVEPKTGQTSSALGNLQSLRSQKYNMKQQQQQQQQGEQQQQREEEYLAAQRAAVESVYVGRATSEAVAHQGEQLKRADRLADDTQYSLDRAQRTLKGMTWGGMVSNWFTPNVKAPTYGSSNETHAGLQHSLESYDVMPPDCQGTAQAIKNYHANVSVLLECETEEQKETCQQICDNMHLQAVSQLGLLKPNNTQQMKHDKKIEAYILQLESDLKQLRNQQLASQAQIRGLVEALDSGFAVSETGDAVLSSLEHNQQKEELFGRKPSTSSTNSPSPQTQPQASPIKSHQEQRQDQHLAVLSASLGELGHIATNLKEGLHQQSHLIDTLETKADNLNESSKRVARRTDRLIQSKSWTPAKPVFQGLFALRHVDTGKYLSVLQTDVYLVNRYTPLQCAFGIHQRPQTRLVGLRCRGNGKWMGQAFLTGSLQCAATSMGRREEFEMDFTDFKASLTAATETQSDASPTKTTRLLCASAGWGHGGYLQVHPSSLAISIGGSTVDDNRTAARFCLVPVQEE